MSRTNDRSFLQMLRRSLQRDRELPVSHVAMKGLRYGAAFATAPVFLLACDSVGPRVRTRCRPLIDNGGYIKIGARVILNSMFSPVELFTGRRGRIEIGDDTEINFGSVIMAEDRVTLGVRVRLASYVTISDRDTEPFASLTPKPITIGDDVWLTSRVRVRGGAVIGSGSVIAAGSDVSGEIPPNVIAGGTPARVIRRLSPSELAAMSASNSASTRAPWPDAGRSGYRGLLFGVPRRAVSAAGSALARLMLAGVDGVGARPRLHGRPFIENLGQILIGDDLRLMSTPICSHLTTGKGGVIRIGDGVAIGAGAAISAGVGIEIGDGVTLGPSVTLLDSDYHSIGDRAANGLSAPIVIEAHARIDERAVILRGAHIGRNAHVAAGSVVPAHRRVPDGAFVAGVPARIVPRESSIGAPLTNRDREREG